MSVPTLVVPALPLHESTWVNLAQKIADAYQQNTNLTMLPSSLQQLATLPISLTNTTTSTVLCGRRWGWSWTHCSMLWTVAVGVPTGKQHTTLRNAGQQICSGHHHNASRASPPNAQLIDDKTTVCMWAAAMHRKATWNCLADCTASTLLGAAYNVVCECSCCTLCTCGCCTHNNNYKGQIKMQDDSNFLCFAFGLLM